MLFKSFLFRTCYYKVYLYIYFIIIFNIYSLTYLLIYYLFIYFSFSTLLLFISILILTFIFYILIRWLARTAYGIPGNEYDDLYYGCCCPCCSVNQVLQTTKTYGYPPKSGTIFNQEEFSSPIVSSNCLLCISTFLCTPCTIGEIAQNGLGMPWWMGFCFLTPCSIRNLIRYHYRIRGNDLMEELCIPCSLYGTASCLALFFCLFSPCICIAMCPSYVSFLSQLVNETNLKKTGEYHRYLIGYNLSLNHNSHSNIDVSVTRQSEYGTELNQSPIPSPVTSMNITYNPTTISSPIIPPISEQIEQ